MLVGCGQSRLAIDAEMAERILLAVPSDHGAVPGNPRPAESCTMMKRTLFDLVSGDRARILKINGSGMRSIKQRLLDMGVMRGADILVERHAPLGDPVEVQVKGYYLALRMSEAREIDVEVL